jgi:hypothetical protein
MLEWLFVTCKRPAGEHRYRKIVVWSGGVVATALAPQLVMLIWCQVPKTASKLYMVGNLKGHCMITTGTAEE